MPLKPPIFLSFTTSFRVVPDSRCHARARLMLALNHEQGRMHGEPPRDGCHRDDKSRTERKRLCAVLAGIRLCDAAQHPGPGPAPQWCVSTVSHPRSTPDMPCSALTSVLCSDKFPPPRIACFCLCPLQALLFLAAHIPPHSLTHSAGPGADAQINASSPRSAASLPHRSHPLGSGAAWGWGCVSLILWSQPGPAVG